MNVNFTDFVYCSTISSLIVLNIKLVLLGFIFVTFIQDIKGIEAQIYLSMIKDYCSCIDQL